jgi:hypothetical protein
MTRTGTLPVGLMVLATQQPSAGVPGRGARQWRGALWGLTGTCGRRV